MTQHVRVKFYPESPWSKQHLPKRFFCGRIGFKFKEETRQCYIWSIALYSAENWTHRKK
jgi:hypothetical protein